MFFSIHNPAFHLNDREHQIFELEDSLAMAVAYNMDWCYPVDKWKAELAALIARRFTDTPTSRPHKKESKRGIADRNYVFGEPQWIHPRWRQLMEENER